MMDEEVVLIDIFTPIREDFEELVGPDVWSALPSGRLLPHVFLGDA